MPYIPHTQADIDAMLAAIGVDSLDALFRDVPAGLALERPVDIPAMDEFALQQYFMEAAAQNRIVAPGKLFLGAGAYQHHTPAAVFNLINRGEFVTCYTPYQAEVSQGTLQSVFEFQSHICALTAMEVANASMYDGATALAEAILMAVRVTRRNKAALPATLHPNYRQVCETFLRGVGVEIVTLPESNGETQWAAGESLQGLAAVVVQTPNFVGVLEDGAAARALADEAGALLVACCNPVALAVIAPPGEFGADIAVGEAQPLGIPLQYGGPYAGYFAAREKFIRNMPGRIVGRTTDAAGNEGYVHTRQTRAPHNRREKATSNICTNQGLFALMCTMHLTFVGKDGLVEVAESCVGNLQALLAALSDEVGLRPRHEGAPFFHEAVIELPIPAVDFLAALREEHGIVGGLALSRYNPEDATGLLVCTTELQSAADIAAYASAARAVLAEALVS